MDQYVEPHDSTRSINPYIEESSANAGRDYFQSAPVGFDTEFDTLQAKANNYYTQGVNYARPMQYIQTPTGRFLSVGPGNAPVEIKMGPVMSDPDIATASAAHDAAVAVGAQVTACEIYPGLWADPGRGPVDVAQQIKNYQAQCIFSQHKENPQEVMDLMSTYHISAAEMDNAVNAHTNFIQYLRAAFPPDGFGGLKIWSREDLDKAGALMGVPPSGRSAPFFIGTASEVLDKQLRRLRMGMSLASEPGWAEIVKPYK